MISDEWRATLVDGSVLASLVAFFLWLSRRVGSWVVERVAQDAQELREAEADNRRLIDERAEHLAEIARLRYEVEHLRAQLD